MSMEAMLDAGADEDDRSASDGPHLVADHDLGAAGHHHVQLVLGVGRLRIGRTCIEDVQAARQVGDGDELVVQATAGRPSRLELVELPSIHRPSLPSGRARPGGEVRLTTHPDDPR